MIPVFFTNQNYIYMSIKEAKDFITSQPNKDAASIAYAKCWLQLKSREKVKLEVWWNENHTQLKFYHDNSTVLQGESTGSCGKEVVELILSPEEIKGCEAELEAMERERELKQEQLSYLMENNN